VFTLTLPILSVTYTIFVDEALHNVLEKMLIFEQNKQQKGEILQIKLKIFKKFNLFYLIC